MFKGRYEHSIDSKGRISIPSKFRDVLDERFSEHLVITNHFDPCLVAYPLQAWRDLERKVAEMPQFDKRVTYLKRFFISGAVECPIDKSGRILLPQNLREYADLSKDVVLMGQVRTIEIWAKEKWSEEFEKLKTSFNAEALSDFGL
ncbi:MAG: division/cell wall cluster transcriptional repressor MraZ [Pseudomonadota bacterium]